MKKLRGLLFVVVAFTVFVTGCGSDPAPPVAVSNCAQLSVKPAPPSSNSLPYYDSAVEQLLNSITQSPPSNDGGQIVWGTRYYLESLLVAYEATGNPKYLTSFISTGTTVLGLAKTADVPDVSDPSVAYLLSILSSSGSPLQTTSVTGWPTNMGTLGQFQPVPSPNGQISLYAQTIWPTPSGVVGYLHVLPSTSGGVTVNFELGDRVWQSYAVSNESDLDGISKQPIVYGGTLGRIVPSGLGLPAPGLYPLDFPAESVWHAEQTAGILLPFARFLLMAKRDPSIADPDLVSAWKAQVIAIANSYEDEFIGDGNGGLVLTNAFWMPSPYAGLPVETDYINAEISLRMLLYLVTSDSHQLSLAAGLFNHELRDLPFSSKGWVLAKESPDATSWSQASEAPKGSIWAAYQGDNMSPQLSNEGGFLVETLQIASDYSLGKDIGMTEEICQNERQTFQEYLRLSPPVSNSLIRATYPMADSKASDAPVPSDDPEDAARYVLPITADPTFICDNWNWMLKNGITTDEGVGHILLDWARSEQAWRQLSAGHCVIQ